LKKDILEIESALSKALGLSVGDTIDWKKVPKDTMRCMILPETSALVEKPNILYFPPTRTRDKKPKLPLAA
jgi:hypothetical protein